ncbi:MAG: HDOD domain-containing protein [Desulfovibrionaceae bacterium]
MGKVNIHSLKPGMVLAEEVKDRNGRMLLGAGVALNEKNLRILKIWGVSEADVEGVSRDEAEGDLASDLDPELVEAAMAYMRDRFRHNDLAYEPVAEILRHCALRKARFCAAQGSGPEALACTREAIAPPMPQHAPEPAPAPGNMDPYQLVRDDLKLGSLPMVFHKLVEAVNDSRSSSSDVAEVISHDTDLSAQLLKVVNSAFYGLRSKIDTISRAVAVIGSNQLISLAMGFSVITFFKGIPDELINMRAFWTHSIACGVAARIISSYHNTPNTERFFVTGLLHDVGRLVMYKLLPGPSRAALEAARSRGVFLHEAERDVFGFSHDKLGGVVLKKWKCPVSLEKNVRYHHNPNSAPNKLEASIILMADFLANAMEQGTSGEVLVPTLPPPVWQTLGMPLSVLTQTVEQVDYQVNEIVHFFTDES